MLGMRTFLIQSNRRGVSKSKRCLSVANLVVDHLLVPILLREERHEMNDVGVVGVELIFRTIKAQDERSRTRWIILLLGWDNRWHFFWGVGGVRMSWMRCRR